MQPLWNHLETQIQQFPYISSSFLFILTISQQILRIYMETVLNIKSNIINLNLMNAQYGFENEQAQQLVGFENEQAQQLVENEQTQQLIQFFRL